MLLSDLDISVLFVNDNKEQTLDDLSSSMRYHWHYLSNLLHTYFLLIMMYLYETKIYSVV